MAISVDLGPSSRADARVYVDDQGDRLLIVSNRGGCLAVLGVGLVAAVATCQAPVAAGRFEWWQLAIGLGFGLLGGWLLFGRSWIRLDRRRSLVEHGISILTHHPYERRPLGSLARVVIVQNDSVSTDSDGHSTTTTTFPVTLEGDGVPSLPLATAGIWENAIPVSEAVARFLHLPLHDRAIGKTRAPHELDLALREQTRSRADDPAKRRPRGVRAAPHLGAARHRGGHGDQVRARFSFSDPGDSRTARGHDLRAGPAPHGLVSRQRAGGPGRPALRVGRAAHQPGPDDGRRADRSLRPRRCPFRTRPDLRGAAMAARRDPSDRRRTH